MKYTRIISLDFHNILLIKSWPIWNSLQLKLHADRLSLVCSCSLFWLENINYCGNGKNCLHWLCLSFSVFCVPTHCSLQWYILIIQYSFTWALYIVACLIMGSLQIFCILCNNPLIANLWSIPSCTASVLSTSRLKITILFKIDVFS